MKATHVYRSPKIITGFDETIYCYALYLAAEQTEFICHISDMVIEWQNRTNWTDKFIIDRFYSWMKIPPELPNKKTMMDLYKKANLVSSERNKIKVEEKYMAYYKSILSAYRKAVTDTYEKLIFRYKFTNLFGLFDNEALLVMQAPDYDPGCNKEDKLVGILHDRIYDKDKFMLLPVTLEKHLNIITDETKILSVNESSFFSVPLFTIPYFENFDADKMRAVRNRMQPAMRCISGSLEELKRKVQNEIFGEKIQNIISGFNEKIKPEREQLQNNISQELYFQYEKNSGGEWLDIEVFAGVCSVETIVDYYQKSKSIYPFVSDALKKKLALKTGLDKCDAFLYLSFPRKHTEYDTPGKRVDL